MLGAEVAFEEGLLALGRAGPSCVDAAVQLREGPQQCLCRQGVLGIEMRVEGAVREPGSLHDLGDADAGKAPLAEQLGGLVEDLLVLLGSLGGGIAHAFSSFSAFLPI